MKVSVHHYRGCRIIVRSHAVTVHDERFDAAVYLTTTLKAAMRWVDGYAEGQVGATLASIAFAEAKATYCVTGAANELEDWTATELADALRAPLRAIGVLVVTLPDTRCDNYLTVHDEDMPTLLEQELEQAVGVVVGRVIRSRGPDYRPSYGALPWRSVAAQHHADIQAMQEAAIAFGLGRRAADRDQRLARFREAAGI